MAKMRKTVVLVAGMLLVTGAGCGGGGKERREYSLPSSFCGVELDQSLYEPLFPPGQELEVVEDLGEYDGYLAALQICDFKVDDTLILSVDSRASSPSSSRRIDPGIEAYLGYWAEIHAPLEPPTISDSTLVSTEPREVRVWPNMAASFISCTSTNEISNYTGMNFSISAFWLEGNDDLSAELTPLIEEYVDKRLPRIDPVQCRTN